MPRPDCGGAGRRAGAWAVGAALALLASHAAARPLQVEDLLQREGLGAVEIAPGERWLLVEQRGPFAAGARFDFGDDLNRLFRTRLMVADLAAGGPLRPLFAPEPETGYRLGPVSPDGARAVVYRLTPERWELGIATLASGRVVWTGLTPEAPSVARTVQWASGAQLVAITLAPGVWPLDIRLRRSQAALPARWAATARGEASVTVVGSGAHLGERPAPPAKRVTAISADTGAAETLATGDFVDLELSPSGRRLALLEAAEDIPLLAGRPVHRVYGLATRRLRLRLLDLESGRLSRPCPECDVLASLLAWSPAGDALLAYVRADGAPWTDGRLVRVDARRGRVERVGADVRAALVLRVERVAAGWLDGEPILFGRRAGDTRDDWFRLAARGPVKLTGALARPAREIVVSEGAFLAAADGAAWRIDRGGRARRLTTHAFIATARRSEGLAARTADGAVRADALSGVEGQGDAAVVRRFRGPGTTPDEDPILAAGQVLAVGAQGAAVDVTSGGGAERLVWRRAGADEVTLAAFNRRLADVDRPAPVAIEHAGPDGQPLRSWLFLPPPGAGPPPPLVVVPYPERTFPGPPARVWNDAPIAPAAALVGRGYAVLLPSLPSARDNTGPADRLAERVLAIVEAARRQPDVAGRFDAGRLALWGHSFGGYAATTIIGQTNRFRAAVAVAPATDLISRHGEFGPGRRIHADESVPTSWSAGWVETLQGDMRAPPWEAPERYLRNSPLMGAGRIDTPLLIAYGENDGSHPGQAEELFSALLRQDKDALLLAYWGETHLLASPGNLRDLYRRAFAFLDEHLGPVDSRAAVMPGSAPPPGRPEPASANAGPRTPGPPPP